MKEINDDWLKNYNLLIFDEIDSTNEEAKRLVRAGVNNDFVIWAKSQDDAVSKSGKKWISDQGNLFLSILLFSPDDKKYNLELQYVAALAVGEMLHKFAREDKVITYKWPNDILINDKKLAGIFVESVNDRNLPAHIVIGIGINIDSSPNLHNNITTDLVKESMESLDLNKSIDELMKSFIYWFDIWQTHGMNPIREKWLERCSCVGKAITITFGNNRMSGIFKDITDTGCVNITLSSGQEYQIFLG